MNKEEIFKKLYLSDLDKNKIIIISGASLVVQNIIDSTKDIDIACDLEYYNSLDWKVKTGAFNIDIKINDVFEISYNLFYPDDYVIINGFKFMNLKRCLEIKERLNKEKDKEVIKKLKEII